MRQENDTSGMAFILHQVLDRVHHGVVAYVFEHPVGWQARSDVQWNFQHVSFPLLTYAQAFNPAGAEVFSVLPLESFCFLQPDYGMYPHGSNLLGQTYLPPMPAVDALARYVAPKHRGRREGFTIRGAGPVPGLAQELAVNLHGMNAEGAVVRVAYREHGHALEEDFYGVYDIQQVPYYGPQGLTMQINWGFLRLFAYRAEQGQLDTQRDVFWRIARSLRLNPQWEQLYAQVMQQLSAQFNQYIQAGYDQIAAAGQLSRSISAANDAWLQTFEQQRQAAAFSSAASRSSSDRSPTEGFSEYIRGVETMDDPYWGESQQDYNYRYHWTDGFGNYQHSNDAFFNPNIGSSQNWTLMEPKKR
jgi:hypothetical protein